MESRRDDGNEPQINDDDDDRTTAALSWALVRWKSAFCTLLRGSSIGGDSKVALLPDSLVGSTARMCLDKAVILVSRVIKHKEASNDTIVELTKFTLLGLPPSKRR